MLYVFCILFDYFRLICFVFCKFELSLFEQIDIGAFYISLMIVHLCLSKTIYKPFVLCSEFFGKSCSGFVGESSVFVLFCRGILLSWRVFNEVVRESSRICKNCVVRLCMKWLLSSSSNCLGRLHFTWLCKLKNR